jgi:iron-regulated transporter 1
MGLLGTLFMPVLERKIGITRAGAWSIWWVAFERVSVQVLICTASVCRGEVASLLPTVLCLFKGPGPLTASSLASVINTLIFFATLSISRLWLYCFDLVQLQGLLLALEHHPQRSEFAAMQVTMENLFDLAKYSVVLVLNKPEQYKWTAMISLICVFIAVSMRYLTCRSTSNPISSQGITYSTYLFQDRGHVFHFGKKNDDVYPTDTQDSELLLLASGVDR